ncbi:DUF4352 domain-containing protein [Marinococcus luteus]|uniref:DUF4352 domain-containing protein n=1 Tax=Marinococcus luteus TaxID=1122204 RepID=UPI002ACCA070|nr:DUF4352 domain-containing protein [Marinococcus luteus]MDZ5782128.1 DUF4352 domain-containing protein [Marinococcus luteus]
MENLFLLLFILSFLVLVIWAVHAGMRLIAKRALFEKIRTKHYVISFVGLFAIGFGGYALVSDDATNNQQAQEESTEETESETDEQEQRAEELDQREQELEEREQALEQQEEEQNNSEEQTDTNSEETSESESDSSEESSDTENENSSEDSSEANSSDELGETVDVGAVSFQINDVSTASTVGSEYASETAEGTYIVLDMVYTNNGSEAAMVDSSQVRLKQDGKTFEADTTASTYANSSDDPSDAADFLFSEVNPGSSIEGQVVFDVTDEVAEDDHLEAEVTEGVFGTNSSHITLK